MADDISITIGLEVLGKRKVLDAQKTLNRLQRELATLAIQEKQGAVAAGSLNKALQQSQSALAKKTGSLTNATRVIQQYGNALKSASVAEIEGARRMNQLGQLASVNTQKFKRFSSVGLQQVGYQVGDFAVQIQSGTNALVAFGQQGSQLAGIFGPAGAIAGAGIAIATALATALFQLKSAVEIARELEKSISNVGEAVDDLGGLITNNMINKLSESNQELAKFARTIQDIRIRELQDAIESFRDSFMDVVEAQNTATPFDRAFGEQRKQIGLIEKALERIGGETQQEVNQSFAEAVNIISEIPGVSQEIIDTLIKQGEEAGIVREVLKQVKDEFEGSAQSAAKIPPILSTITDLTGQASGAVGGLMDRFLDAAGAAGKIVQVLATVGKQLQSLGGAFTSLSKLPIPSGLAQGALGGLGVASDLLGQLAGSEGLASLATSMVAAGENMYSQATSGSSGGGGGGGGGSGGVDQTIRMREEYQKMLNVLNDIDPAILKYNDDLKKLNEWLKAGAITQGQYNDALKLLQQRLTEATDPLKSFREELEKTLDPDGQALKAAQALNNALADFLFNPFEDGVKGMVLQFSNALRRMASEAIAAQIMKSIIGPAGSGNIFTSIFSANGNVFSRGSVVPFANGGVVGGPTMFPMAGRNVGIMGEAGPEAIMPLKRKNGKLGVEVSGESQQQQETSVKVINIDDRASIGQYLEGPAGEKVVMNVLRRNGVV